MRDEEREAIERLRELGWEYEKIATALELSRDVVRNCCKRIKMAGYIADTENITCCRNCHKPLLQAKTGRRRKFCSDKCRREWGNIHPKMYKHDCQFCERKFESRVSKQKYCSHKCYIRDRFWRQEDAEEVIELLRKGKYPEKIPKWIKDMLLGEPEQIP